MDETFSGRVIQKTMVLINGVRVDQIKGWSHGSF